jgi:hypothetical protein
MTTPPVPPDSTNERQHRGQIARATNANSAALAAEAKARAAGDAGLQTQFTTLASEIYALAGSVLVGGSPLGSSGNLIVQGQLSDDLVSKINQIGLNATQIIAQQATILAQGTSIAKTAADLLAEATTRGSADDVLAASISTTKSDLLGVSASVVSEAATRASADLAIAASVTTLTANLATANAAIVTEQGVRASADTALATSVSTLTTTVSGNTAAIATESAARVSGDSANTTAITSLTATVNSNKSTAAAAVATEATARATADTALSNTISTLSATVDTNTAAISSEATTRANADSALSTTLTSLAATVTTNKNTAAAAVGTEATARANGDSANAALISTLTTTVNNNTAAISTNATTQASVNGAIQAEYTIKAQTMSNGKLALAGIGLIADGTSGQSEIDIIANKLFITGLDNNGALVRQAAFSVVDGTVYAKKISSTALNSEDLNISAGGLASIDISGTRTTFAGLTFGPRMVVNDVSGNTRVIIGHSSSADGIWIYDAGGNLIFEQDALSDGTVGTTTMVPNAATVAGSASIGNHNGTGAWQTVASLTVNLNVVSKLIIANVEMGFPSGPKTTGVQILDPSGAVIDSVEGPGSAAYFKPGTVISCVDTNVPVGNNTYTLQFWGQDSNARTSGGTFIVLAAKR